MIPFAPLLLASFNSVDIDHESPKTAINSALLIVDVLMTPITRHLFFGVPAEYTSIPSLTVNAPPSPWNSWGPFHDSKCDTDKHPEHIASTIDRRATVLIRFM